MSSIYIAGPMTGLPECNYPAFMAKEYQLSREGWKVLNPAKNPFVQDIYDFDYRKAYLWDIEQVINSDAIFMLKGWEKGHGARGEHAIACAVKNAIGDKYEIVYE